MRGSWSWLPHSPTASFPPIRVASSGSTCALAGAAGASWRCSRTSRRRSLRSPFARLRLTCADASSRSAEPTRAGAPAAGLAYLWRGIVVVQYLVPTELIRRPPEVREALRGAGFYATSEQGRGIIAFVADGCGTLLMVDASPEELRWLM